MNKIKEQKLKKITSEDNQVDTIIIPPIVEKALIEAYKKHHMGLDNIGWNELGNLLADALCELKGDDWFQNFIKKEAIQ